jgi:hypothetical protein
MRLVRLELMSSFGYLKNLSQLDAVYKNQIQEIMVKYDLNGATIKFKRDENKQHQECRDDKCEECLYNEWAKELKPKLTIKYNNFRQQFSIGPTED